jgi:hypothetical protein
MRVRAGGKYSNPSRGFSPAQVLQEQGIAGFRDLLVDFLLQRTQGVSGL